MYLCLRSPIEKTMWFKITAGKSVKNNIVRLNFERVKQKKNSGENTSDKYTNENTATSIAVPIALSLPASIIEYQQYKVFGKKLSFHNEVYIHFL